MKRKKKVKRAAEAGLLQKNNRYEYDAQRPCGRCVMLRSHFFILTDLLILVGKVIRMKHTWVKVVIILLLLLAFPLPSFQVEAAPASFSNLTVFHTGN